MSIIYSTFQSIYLFLIMKLEFQAISKKGKNLSNFVDLRLQVQTELLWVSNTKSWLESLIIERIHSTENKRYYYCARKNERLIWYRMWREWVSEKPKVFESMHIYLKSEFRGLWYWKQIKNHQVELINELWFDRHRTEEEKKNIIAKQLLTSIWFKKEIQDKWVETYLLKHSSDLSNQ